MWLTTYSPDYREDIRDILHDIPIKEELWKDIPSTKLVELAREAYVSGKYKNPKRALKILFKEYRAVA